MTKYWEFGAKLIEECAKIAENPYSDEVEAYGPDEPFAVGAKIASAIRSLALEAERKE